MKKTILFDNNGVLTANENTYLICANFLGVDKARLKKAFLKFAPALDKGEITQNEFYEKILRELRINKPVKELREVHLSAYKRKEEMIKLALQLKKSYTLALLTNFGDGFEEANKRFWNLNEIFEENLIFASYKIGMAKPDKDIFHYVLRALNLEKKPQNVVFIDDNEDNINTAKYLGIDAILFRNKEDLLKELESRGIKP